MSTTTICMPVINSITPELTEEAIVKTYLMANVPIPTIVKEEPITTNRFNNKEVNIVEVAANMDNHARERDDSDVINYYIMPGVYVSYIREY